METIRNIKTAKERALYGIIDKELVNCRFEGEEDGESALKESCNVIVRDTYFDLRYPFWHCTNSICENIEMTEKCRAAFWYTKNISIENSILNGTKVLRECGVIRLVNSDITSQELGWFCKNIVVENLKTKGEYSFFKSSKMKVNKLQLTGKYSFQYVKDVEIRNSILDTKDAFWESENVTVIDSVIKGEYLGWYAKNLKLIRCKIIGTQPLCYCDNLTLEDCEMIDTDLAFEYSSVNATIINEVDSIKNPISGKIVCKKIKELIFDENRRDNNSVIIEETN